MKERRQEKDAKTSRERDFKEKACRENKRPQEKDMPRERE